MKETSRQHKLHPEPDGVAYIAQNFNWLEKVLTAPPTNQTSHVLMAAS